MNLNSTLVRRIAAYACTIIVSILCVWLVWDLWKADLRYPLVETVGDVIIAQGVVFKSLTENSWVLDNPRLGAPFGLNMRDFPQADLLVLGSAKLLALFTKNHVLIRNLVAIGSYPLVACASLYAMRRLGIRFAIACVSSLLFAFLTYHNTRIGAHIFFGVGYFTVPFASLLALDLFANRPLFFEGGVGSRLQYVGGTETWRASALCAVMGLTGTVYYPFFSCYLLMVAGVFAAFHIRSVVPLLRSLFMQGIIAVALFVCLLPTLVHEHLHGHSASMIRDSQAAEVYGLKIVQMILPGSGHRLEAWNRIGSYYNRMAPLVTENRTAYLGFVGIAGFLYLLFVLMRGQQRNLRLHTLSVLNIAALLLGTIGGFSSLMSFLVTNKIRSYNRICVYIAFFALLALAMVAERAAKFWVNTRSKQAMAGGALLGILWLGLWDQYALDIDYAALKKNYIEEDKFVAQIESRLPRRSMLFQYPYFPFPEHAAIAQLPEYAPMIPYLHSKTLRWSYGAIKGRRADAWIAKTAGLPVAEAVERLALAGYAAIYVSRDGYGDHGARLEESLTVLLGKPIVVSPRGDRAVFTLAPQTRILEAKYGQEEFRRRQQDVLTPMYLDWRDGFYPTERVDQTEQNWCSARCRFVIENPASRPKHVVLNANLLLAASPATVRLQSDLFTRSIRVKDSQYHLSDGFDVPPGEHFVEVETDLPRGAIDDAMRDKRVAFVGTKLETLGQ